MSPGWRTLAALVLAFGLGSGAQADAVIAVPLPEPPLPPEQPQAWQNFAPAPVPNHDAQDPTTEEQHTRLTPTLAPQVFHRQGDGYVNGSASEYDPVHRPHPTPGFKLRVPLEQH